MKITDEEREAAYELKWLVDEILMGRERAALYARVYVEAFKIDPTRTYAADCAKFAIVQMDKAFEPVCPACEQEASGPRLAN